MRSIEKFRFAILFNEVEVDAHQIASRIIRIKWEMNRKIFLYAISIALLRQSPPEIRKLQDTFYSEHIFSSHCAFGHGQGGLGQ